MPREIRAIAKFLDIAVDETKWADILTDCSFDYMKANAGASVPAGGAFGDGGAEVFVHKGLNGRWRDVLSKGESDAYEERAIAELGPDCAHWLMSGQRT